MQTIDWKSIPETTSPALYHRLKQEILSLRDSGLVLIRLAELKQRMEMTLLARPGVVWELAFGSWVPLQPERINASAQAVKTSSSRREEAPSENGECGTWSSGFYQSLVTSAATHRP